MRVFKEVVPYSSFSDAEGNHFIKLDDGNCVSLETKKIVEDYFKGDEVVKISIETFQIPSNVPLGKEFEYEGQTYTRFHKKYSVKQDPSIAAILYIIHSLEGFLRND